MVIIMKEINTIAIDAKDNPTSLEKLIKQQEAFILRCASKTCHRYITKSDDEWSISLLAFSEAVNNFEQNKGSFLSFSELVIRRRLIDYIKSQSKYNSEVSIDPILFDSEPEEDNEDVSLRISIAEQVSKQETGNTKLEIEAVNTRFSEYGFTFFDLSECSPHAGKTKKACAKAVNYMLNNPLLLKELQSTKQLPLKTIEKYSHVPRKILERHRKYIIAALEILSGDYPCLAEYLRYIREEISE